VDKFLIDKAFSVKLMMVIANQNDLTNVSGVSAKANTKA
jgi:hypothetical protein